jgi:hydrogenase maturation protease
MWRIVRGVLAGSGLVLAGVGFIVFATAAVGVWWLKADVNRRTDVLADKALTAVNAGGHAVEFVNDVITQADRDLDQARRTAPVAPQQPVQPLFQFAAVQASQNLAGSVERAHAAIVTASDAVVVGESAVQMLGEDEKLRSWLGVKPDQLVQTRTDLTTAASELKRVRTVLGIPVDGGAGPTGDQLAAVGAALGRAQDFTNRMGEVVADARLRVDQTKRAVDLWVLRLALGITTIGVLGAAGQVFMARACWRALGKDDRPTVRPLGPMS